MKNEHPAFFPPKQDDIVNSLNFHEGIGSNWSCSFTTFLIVTDWCVGSVTD